MADLRRSVRDLFLQGVEAVNNAANHVANATRSKVDEMNLRNRRKELADSLASALYEQWQQGLALPEELTKTLEEIRGIDEQLQEMASQPEPVAETTEEAPEAVPTMDVPEEIPVEAPRAYEKPDVSEVPSIQVEDEPEESSRA